MLWHEYSCVGLPCGDEVDPNLYSSSSDVVLLDSQVGCPGWPVIKYLYLGLVGGLGVLTGIATG